MKTWDSLVKRDELHGLNRKGQHVSDAELKVKPYFVAKPHTGFRWNDGDYETFEWYPQGIAGITNADESRKFLLVSWYHANKDKDKDGKGFKGVRVSLVDVTDMGDIWYRHVLLVEKDGASIRPIVDSKGKSVHAGGIAVHGTTLFVADSANDLIRTFDLNRLIPAAADGTKLRCELTSAGTYYAYDYRYILIQRAARRVSPAILSSMSMDWTNPSSPSLITCGFYYKHYHTPPSVVWWQPRDIVDADAVLKGGTTPPGLTGVIKNRMLGEKAQGVTRVGKSLWVSRSHGRSNRGELDIFDISDPAKPRKTLEKADWPIGAEAIYAAKTSDNVWCCTEFPGKRVVFAVKKSAYP
ncbi:MAG: hypothetical protein KBG48_09955 [Kofleriaceae bacterium]|nr:hypothetical protein [Kofleriaceae bacterium]MBP9167702.1 hypothetical protein [Kofleriaceae bacterium]MBP9857801.1 hypothetical protein [Kofleriaceae bacterium]